MTPAQLARVVANPRDPNVWKGWDLTPAQLAAILAALGGGHLTTGGNSPAQTYAGGDGGSVNANNGTDSSFLVSGITGTGIAAGGAVVTVIWAVAYNSVPRVTVTPQNTPVASSQVAVTPTAGGLTIKTINALGAGVGFTWSVHVVGSPN